MRSSRRGTRYAVFGYVLSSAVVLGGMTWATVLTWRLAELDVVNERAAQTREALWRMDAYVGSILASETKREYNDFVAIRKPDAIWSRDLDDLDPNEYRQPSPIALYGPPYDWIELYFQVDHHGHWSSPHLPIENAPWDRDTFVRIDRLANRGRDLLEQLRVTLPLHELEARLERVMEQRHTALGIHQHAPDATLAQTGIDVHDRSAREYSHEFQMRSRSQLGLQERYLPPTRCVPEDIVEENILSVGASKQPPPQESSDQVWSVEISPSPLVGFWLPSAVNDDRKLAFVRTLHADNQVLHQGFVADWNRLRPELLAQITDLFKRDEAGHVFKDLRSERYKGLWI